MADRDQRKLAAIFVADLVGYSRLTEADEAGTLRRLKAAREQVLDPAIGEFGGRIVHTAGDGVLSEFPSVVDAVQCAANIQNAMIDHGRGEPDEAQSEFSSELRHRRGDVGSGWAHR
ncbi:MAG: adenylate/guanylate cyclase domain-containing protein [Alphaproteobacteria bacterium]|nr:adenylate/guanylate cyclase domain-containing protein [Alphaproteobacteria bacterium]